MSGDELDDIEIFTRVRIEMRRRCFSGDERMDMCTSLYTEQISAFVARLIWMIDVPRAPQGYHHAESAMSSERVGCDESPPFRPNLCSWNGSNARRGPEV